LICIKVAAARLGQHGTMTGLSGFGRLAMIGFVEAPQAWGLTRGMARVLGLNLTHAVVDGWLTRPELGDLLDRCQACNRSADCTTWLARQVSTPALPEFCPNKAALEALSPAAH
jgi:Family of unknown function (DUF6455)